MKSLTRHVIFLAISFAVVVCCECCLLAQSQPERVAALPTTTVTLPVGQNTELWDFTAPAEHHNSIVQIKSGDGIGTGIVIKIDEDKPIKNGHEGYCLTAWHVVENDDGQGEIAVSFRNGAKAKDCQVIAHDEAADVAIIWVWVPDEIEPATVSEDRIQGGDGLEFAGLGGGSELTGGLRHFSATASLPSSQQKIFADVPLLPGDSGGPVFNSENELVGIISGGWFWWDAGVRNRQDSRISATWPARAANVGPIRDLMVQIESRSTEAIHR